MKGLNDNNLLFRLTLEFLINVLSVHYEVLLVVVT